MKTERVINYIEESGLHTKKKTNKQKERQRFSFHRGYSEQASVFPNTGPRSVFLLQECFHRENEALWLGSLEHLHNRKHLCFTIHKVIPSRGTLGMEHILNDVRSLVFFLFLEGFFFVLNI